MSDRPTPDTPMKAPDGTGYRVLARKYRPANFEDLIGQEAMVRTLSNAFETGRIPQAWILTGVRGVGKTTTARILARALNYELPDGSVKAPTIHMPVMGTHDQAIIDSRHIDVLEMDAASHNGVDDVRQINDAARYAPVSARYKVYILDEVHMLSTAAFNALLKTLEEPPPHVKFIFATTEIRKVPVTVLSRCQRFDLRRVDADVLVQHLAGIATKEGIEAEQAALALIARAAEGSVRDSLSLFDQAIAHSGASAGESKNAAGPVRAEDVRQMLGLADRVRIVDLFEALMKGDIASALTELRAQYEIGADPAVVLGDLAEFTHFVTRMKVVPAVGEDASLSEAERVRGRDFATQLSLRVLSRTWQMLLKGIGEVQASGRPLAAAEMVLVRIAYAADLPTPDEVVRSLNDNGGGGAPVVRGGNGGGGGGGGASAAAQSFTPRFEAPRGAPRAQVSAAPMASSKPMASSEPMASSDLARRDLPEAQPAVVINSFPELIAFVADKRDINAKMALERDVRLVRFEDGKLEIALLPSAPKGLVNELQRKLSGWTGRIWMVAVSREQGAPTMREQANDRQAELREEVLQDPLVQAVLKKFPGAKLGEITQTADEPQLDEAALPPPEMDEDE